MVAVTQVRNTAHNLMLRALELLDKIDERFVAVHLQHAIDTLNSAPIPCTAEEAEALLERPECHAILKWLGIAIHQDRIDATESDEAYYRRRVGEQLAKASTSNDHAAKIVHLDIAAYYATLRERLAHGDAYDK